MSRNVPVGSLQRAFDLELMDTSITPNVGASPGRGVPYRDDDGCSGAHSIARAAH